MDRAYETEKESNFPQADSDWLSDFLYGSPESLNDSWSIVENFSGIKGNMGYAEGPLPTNSSIYQGLDNTGDRAPIISEFDDSLIMLHTNQQSVTLAEVEGSWSDSTTTVVLTSDISQANPQITINDEFYCDSSEVSIGIDNSGRKYIINVAKYCAHYELTQTKMSQEIKDAVTRSQSQKHHSSEM
jgi:hypothetical protein